MTLGETTKWLQELREQTFAEIGFDPKQILLDFTGGNGTIRTVAFIFDCYSVSVPAGNSDLLRYKLLHDPKSPLSKF